MTRYFESLCVGESEPEGAKAPSVSANQISAVARPTSKYFSSKLCEFSKLLENYQKNHTTCRSEADPEVVVQAQTSEAAEVEEAVLEDVVVGDLEVRDSSRTFGELRLTGIDIGRGGYQQSSGPPDQVLGESINRALSKYSTDRYDRDGNILACLRRRNRLRVD
jgi:hypothetical protein